MGMEDTYSPAALFTELAATSKNETKGFRLRVFIEENKAQISRSMNIFYMSIVSNMIVKFDINEFDAYPSPPNLVCETFILLPFHKLS